MIHFIHISSVPLPVLVDTYQMIDKEHARESNKVVDDTTLLRCAVLKHHKDNFYKAMVEKIPASHQTQIDTIMNEIKERELKQYTEIMEQKRKMRRENIIAYILLGLVVAIAISASVFTFLYASK